MGYRYTVADVAELNEKLDQLCAENERLRERIENAVKWANLHGHKVLVGILEK